MLLYGIKGIATYLDGLVDVVVSVLACSGWLRTARRLTLYTLLGVLELSLLTGEPLLNHVGVIVLKLALLNTGHLVVMLLREHLAVLHGLHRRVVVILVDLLVDGSLHTLFLLLGDGLILHSRCYVLVHCGVMVTVLRGEILDCVLGGLHICLLFWWIWFGKEFVDCTL